MINKIVRYIQVRDGTLLVFFKDNSSITIDIKTGARWAHNKKGVKIDELPVWMFEGFDIKI